MEPPVVVVFRGVTYKRNPKGKQRANRVYYSAPRGSGRDLLHRDIWRDHHGRDIPDGHHIHHDDGDPFNNDPANLVALDPEAHAAAHAHEFADARREHAARIRPLTKAWHASEEGREWHRQHGIAAWQGREPIDRRACQQCGEDFDAYLEKARFCSRRCIEAAGRADRRYQHLVPCPVCGSDFWQSKYRPVPKTCSRRCGGISRAKRAS